jgi:regulatory protein
VIAELREQGMVDDARFARVWAESRVASGQSGPHRVRAELRGKGVLPALIEEAVEAVFGTQREAELAAAIAERHLRRMRSLPLEVRLRRLAGLLRRRGFSGSAIAPLLRHHAREDLTIDRPAAPPE